MEKGYTIAAFALYLVIIVIIAALTSKRSSESSGSFFLGGRKLNEWVVAISAVASGRSSWLILGMSGSAYLYGVSAIWFLVGYIVMELILFLGPGIRLRRHAGAKEEITVPDYFSARFGRSNLVRIIAVIAIIIFVIPYTAAQFKAGSKAFETTLGLSVNNGLLLTVLIVLVYTIIGGYLAVCYTDVVQAVMMIAGLVVLPIVAFIHMGGMSSILNSLGEQDPNLLNLWFLGVIGTIGGIGIGLGSPGNPHILVRYMSIDNPEDLRKSALVGTAWNVIMGWGALWIGLIGRAAFPDVSLLDGDQEKVYTSLAQAHLHPFIVGLIIASLAAAIMSTCDSQLLVSASAITRDIYEKIIMKGRDSNQKLVVLLSRLAILVIVLLGLVIATNETISQSIFWMVLLAWAGLGAVFGPALLVSLYWKRMTLAGCIAGMVGGGVVTSVWWYYRKIVLVKVFGQGMIYELIPGFVVSLILIFVVSYLTKQPEDVDTEMKILKGR